MFTEKKYYTIGEFAKKVGVEKYTLRYWETVFPQLKPYKTENGHRRYSNEHVEIVEFIKDIMWNKKYTIEGAKKVLNEHFSKQKATTQFRLNFSFTNVTQFAKEIKKVLSEIIDILEEK